jgi:hypothetical protein
MRDVPVKRIELNDIVKGIGRNDIFPFFKRLILNYQKLMSDYYLTPCINKLDAQVKK